MISPAFGGEEWAVLEDWLSDLATAAPANLKDEAHKVLQTFNVANGRRRAMNELFDALFTGSALAEGAREIWREQEAGHQRVWRSFWEAASDISLKLARSRGRGRGKDINHQLDQRVAVNAFIRAKAGKIDLAQAIRDESRHLCIPFTAMRTEAAFIKRIKRLIEDPLERIEQKAAFALSGALRTKGQQG